MWTTRSQVCHARNTVLDCCAITCLKIAGTGLEKRCNVYKESAMPDWWPAFLGSWDPSGINAANKEHLKKIIVLLLDRRQKRLVRI